MSNKKTYFSINELKRSDKANALGDPNTPNAKETANLQELIDKALDPLRIDIGLPIKINSGFRNDRVNRAVGGVSTSAHRLGHAVDMICPQFKGGSVIEFCRYIEKFLKKNNIKFDQLIYEFVGSSKWVHLGLRNQHGNQRGQVLTIRNRRTHKGIVNV